MLHFIWVFTVCKSTRLGGFLNTKGLLGWKEENFSDVSKLEPVIALFIVFLLLCVYPCLSVFYFSRTPDRYFRCFYPCEIFISHKLIPALRKDKKRTAARWLHVELLRHCYVKMTSTCHISAYSGFSGSLFHVFVSNIKRGFSGEQENDPLFV